MGCGAQPMGAPLAPQQPAPAALATDASVEAQAFADPGVPAGVVIWLRAPAPARDIPILGSVMGIGALIDPSDVLTRKLGPRLSRAIDSSLPADFTVSGFEDDNSGMVLVTGIDDLHTFIGAVAADYEFMHVATGRWHMKRKMPLDGALECEVWQAPAPVGARLLCASQPQLIEAQGPFFMSAARSQVDHANLHAEMSGAAMAMAVKKGAESDGKLGDSDERAGSAMGRQFVTDAVNDMRSLSWDLTLQHDSVELAQVLRFAKSESLFSVAVSGRSGAVQPVPEAFWRLPLDGDVAFYSEGAEPEPMRRVGARLFDGFNQIALQEGDEVIPIEILSQIEKVEQGLFLRGGAWQLAYGQDLTRASDALNAAAKATSGTSKGVDAALTKAEAALGGWALLGLDDDSRGFVDALRSGLGIARLSFPHRKGAKPSPPSSTTETFGEIPIKPASHLPSGSLHFMVTSKPNPKFVAPHDGSGAVPRMTVHFVIVPDSAQHVWVGIARDEASAIARVQGVLTPDAQKTLGADSELRELAKAPVSGLGYGTLAGLTGMTLSAKSKADMLKSRRSLSGLWALPKQGASHVPFWISRNPSGADERRVALTVRLRPDAIGDVLQNFIGFGSDSHVIE